MPLTRREFIGRMAVLAGSQFLPPIVFRAGEAFGQVEPDPASADRNRLIVIFQQGGNDGLNTVVPRGDITGAPRFSVYKKVRPAIHYEPEQTLALDRPGDADQMLGLNPKLTKLHQLYEEGRVAVVQGVDYPNHNYSHFESTDIWHSGQPEEKPDSGWIGRHLDRAGVPVGELRGLGIGTELPLTLFAPRDQRQDAGVLAVTCMNENSGGVFDSFQVGWPPVRVRRGAALVVRFERTEQPSEVKIHGPRGLRPFTLEPYAPEGTVGAWDARFDAPGRPPRRALVEREGKTYYVMVAEATWYGDEECTVYKRGEWGLSLQPRKRQ